MTFSNIKEYRYDTYNGFTYDSKQLTEKEICDVLNEQHETIQSLIKQNKRLHDDLHKINQIARGY